MKLYFVRHGESEANLLREFSNRGFKHGLTDRGREQAAVLAQTLAGTSVVKLCSSPLLRAVQTAEILSRACGVRYEITDALREYDCGILEGKSDAASLQIYETVLNDWLQQGAWEQRIEQGESFLEIKERFVPFIEQLTREYQHSSHAIVAVGHGGLYCCMLPLVLVNIDVRFVIEHPVSYTGCIVAEFRPEGLICVEWCGTAVPSS